MKIRVKQNHWYPRKIGVEAITIVPFVLLSGSYLDAVEKRILHHELVHVRQVREKGWIAFYVSYLWEYLGNRYRGMSHDEAYRRISYEEEAYSLQHADPQPEDITVS